MKYSIIRFYFLYLYYIFFCLLEVKKGKKEIMICEFIWLCNKLFKTNFNLPKNLERNYFETIHGKFFITPDLISTITVSPVFERLDINYLLSTIQSLIERKKEFYL